MHSDHRKRETPAQSGVTGPATTTKAAVASGDDGRGHRPVSADDIRRCAYQKWEGAGKPAGDGIQFWLEAENELMRRH